MLFDSIDFVSVRFSSRGNEHHSGLTDLNYGFIYVAHPRALTHLSWRKTSKYMPKYNEIDSFYSGDDIFVLKFQGERR
jgi:hypothetical protein